MPYVILSIFAMQIVCFSVQVIAFVYATHTMTDAFPAVLGKWKDIFSLFMYFMHKPFFCYAASEDFSL